MPNGAIEPDVVHVNVPAATAQSGSSVEPVVPAGRGSEMTTPAGSVEGPSFVRVIVYVVEVPATTETAPSSLVMTRSAAGVTVVDSLSVSLAGSGSNVVEITSAVFV